MNWFIVKMEVRSALKTPLVSDTLWGHIAWNIVFEKGEKALENFIMQYEEKEPPLILSHAFPEGFLPMPKLRGPVPEQKDIQYKRLLKLAYIPAEFLEKPFNWEILFSQYERQHQLVSASLNPESRIRNSIDRINLTAQPGALWAEHSYVWKKKTLNRDNEVSESVTCMDLYCLSTWDAGEIFEILRYSLNFGYGGKASIGYGDVRILSVEPFIPPHGGNRMMALGCIAAKPSHLPGLLSNVVVRYGKLGPIMAQNLQNPYKKPIVMFDAGSTCDLLAQPFVGSLVKNVHMNPKIVTLGMAPMWEFTEA